MNVLVTRPIHQADTLCALIEQQGGQAIRFPTLDIVAIDNGKLSQQLVTMNEWDWLVFISSNAVNFALLANNGKIDAFKESAIAAVGKATAKALHSAGLNVDLLPETHFNTEGLLATDEMKQVNGKKCLIIRGLGGRERLANQLQERGAKVEYMEVYKREIPKVDNMDVNNMLKKQMFDVITITSGDALKNLMIMVNSELSGILKAVPLIVISNRIKQLAEKIGFETIVVTDSPSDAAIIKTVVQMSL